MTWHQANCHNVFSAMSVTAFSLANTSYRWASFSARRITRQILTSQVCGGGVNLYLQKLKKTCAECLETINGVYYCGQDKRILCETHYKVVVVLCLYWMKYLWIPIYFRNCWVTVLGVERLWKAALRRLTEQNITPPASPAPTARSVWEMAQSWGTNRGMKSTASPVMTSKLVDCSVTIVPLSDC